tara:strand:+ start:223 stop:1734 length:1512 start_codon:yes stop_codon:yes gene_type:complete
VAHRPEDLPSTPEPQLRQERKDKKDKKPPEECEDWLNLPGALERVAADVKASESQLAQVLEAFGLCWGWGNRYSAAAMQRKLEILMNPPPQESLLKLTTASPMVLIACGSPYGAGTGVGFLRVPHHRTLELPLGSALQQETLAEMFYVDRASAETWLNSLPAPLRPVVSSAFEENLAPSDALARATNQDGSTKKLYTLLKLPVKLPHPGHPVAPPAVADAEAADWPGRNDTGASGFSAALAPQLPNPSTTQPQSSHKLVSYKTLSTVGLGGSTANDLFAILCCDTGALGPNEAAACMLISRKLDRTASAAAVDREETRQIIRNHNEKQTNAKLELGLFRHDNTAGSGASDVAEGGDDPVDVREADQAQEDKENAQATLKATERIRLTLERASRVERRAATSDPKQVRLRLRGCSDPVSSGTIPAKGVAVQRMELGSVAASYDGQTRAAGGPLGRLLSHFSAGRAGLRQLLGMLQSGFGPALAQQATSLKAKLFGGGNPATAQA